MEATEATSLSEREREALHYLAIKSLAGPPSCAGAIGTDERTAAEVLAELVARGLADETRIGYRLTDAGEALVRQLREVELADGARERLELAHERFEDLNVEVKRLITDWQVVSIGGQTIPNDHSDPEHDARVIGALLRLHEEFEVLLDDLAAAVPRLARYRDRFAYAVERIEAEDYDFVTRPDRASYHTLWFELHEELLQLLGRTRREE